MSRCVAHLSKKQYPVLGTVYAVVLNMFETVSTIFQERSFASYHRTTEYRPVWQNIFL